MPFESSTDNDPDIDAVEPSSFDETPSFVPIERGFWIASSLGGGGGGGGTGAGPGVGGRGIGVGGREVARARAGRATEGGDMCCACGGGRD